MGADGGTIPTRGELVRLKKKPEKKDKDAERAAKWLHCTLSQQPIVPPLVACELGRLYKKECVLEFLLDRTQNEQSEKFSHIRGLKDVKELKLTENPGYSRAKVDKGDAYIDRQTAKYICPITGLEMSGKYKFVYLVNCRCVFSDRALKEVQGKLCHQCGQEFTTEDIVTLNGTEEEELENRTHMEARRARAKLEKKNKKKRAADVATVSNTGEPSTSKQAKVDAAAPGTSKSTTALKSRDSKPTDGSKSSSKLSNGGNANSSKQNLNQKSSSKKSTSIQDDPALSDTYKSLFTSCDKAKNQTKAHWVTFNPQYF